MAPHHSLMLALTLGAMYFDAAAASSPAQERPEFRIDRTLVKRVRIAFQGEYRIADVTPETWTIFSANAPGLPSQTGVSTSLSPDAKAVREANGEQRWLWTRRVVTTSQTQSFSITYEATLWSRRLTAVGPGDKVAPVDPLPAQERELYLAATRTLDFETKAFQKWLVEKSLLRGKSEGQVAFARRAFNAIVAEYATAEDRITSQPASVYCRLDKADCKVRSIVFAATMRANGIPARVLVGKLASTKQPNKQGLIDSHARAEFFATGVGWVPVDVNYALAARNPATRFGEDPGDMLVEHIDHDVNVPTPDGPRWVFGLDEPMAQVRAKGTGSLTCRASAWDVETVAISAEAAAAEPLQRTPTADQIAPPTPAPLRAPAQLRTDRLAGDRLKTTVDYYDNEGKLQSPSFEGTQDQVAKWMETLPGLSPADLARLKEWLTAPRPPVSRLTSRPAAPVRR